MKAARQVLAIWLVAAGVAYGRGNSFTPIRYHGGTVHTNVDPKDWGNHLTVTPDEITLKLKDGQTLQIDPKLVTVLSYGQEAHRRVVGALHKTRLHFVGIEFTTEDGKHSGVLLQAHKDNYWAVLTALRDATGAPIAVAEGDRKFLPAGLGTTSAETAEKTVEKPAHKKTATVPTAASTSAPAGVQQHSGGSPVPSAAPPAALQPASSQPEATRAEGQELCTVIVKASADGADITLDGKYVGSTPSTVRLVPGDHTVAIEKSGFKVWQRTMTVSPGGIVTIDATLEK